MKYVLCLLVLLCLVSAAPACDPSMFAPLPAYNYQASYYSSGFGLPVPSYYDPGVIAYRQQLLLQQRAFPVYGYGYPIAVQARLPLTVVRARASIVVFP